MTGVSAREPEPRSLPVMLADDPCEAAFGSVDPTGPSKYYRARYYDPKMGRFINEDPIGFIGGVNFYAYVGNNPSNRTDPSGLQACCSNSQPASGLACYSRCVNQLLFNPLAVGVGTVAAAAANTVLPPLVNLANAASGVGQLTNAQNAGAVTSTYVASQLGLLNSIQRALQVARAGAAAGAAAAKVAGAASAVAAGATAAAATVGTGVVLGCATACGLNPCSY